MPHIPLVLIVCHVLIYIFKCASVFMCVFEYVCECFRWCWTKDYISFIKNENKNINNLNVVCTYDCPTKNTTLREDKMLKYVVQQQWFMSFRTFNHVWNDQIGKLISQFVAGVCTLESPEGNHPLVRTTDVLESGCVPTLHNGKRRINGSE